MSYICERCGKQVEDSEKFGSGRFCSRACANARTHSEETKDKIRKSIVKTTECFCIYCGKAFSNITSCRSHERLCPKNPNKLNNPSKQHENKLTEFVTLRNRNTDSTNSKIVLNITYAELERYKQEHAVCEICGRSVEEAVKWNSKYAAKSLCIDHDHTNNTFRGLLCQVCNRQLGWYENNKNKIKEYLNE
jgi:hypothetical protein